MQRRVEVPGELHAPIQVYESLCRRGRIGERELAAVKNLAVEEGEEDVIRLSCGY